MEVKKNTDIKRRSVFIGFNAVNINIVEHTKIIDKK